MVLVDPVVNGHPFKRTCAESGYAVVGVYTLRPKELRALAPGHQAEMPLACMAVMPTCSRSSRSPPSAMCGR